MRALMRLWMSVEGEEIEAEGEEGEAEGGENGSAKAAAKR